MSPFIGEDKKLHCGVCNSHNLALAGNKGWRSSPIRQFSIICNDCSKRNHKLQHVIGLGAIQDLIFRDLNLAIESESNFEVRNNIFENQLRLCINRENNSLDLYKSQIDLEF